ncbi:MAG TPA: histidinol-phosphate transaminase [Candidatus Dormibacteraeota bacterium]|jgi:histidinol-phosphate/aromatic aminotransferase/cobyric acid decarboxylase-like protein|nr:histidinol-phosphate transaminase [Candidatus Dormibacteraeota bacterium]
MSLIPQPAAVHGGASWAGIDLSASLNPLGPSPVALAAARDAVLWRYPELTADSLRTAAARRHGLSVDNVVPVPGAAAGIWLCALLLLGRSEQAVALGPCFGEYRRAVGATGATYVEVSSEPDLRQALAQAPAVCLIANPANPTAVAWPAEKVRDVCALSPRTTFLIDEAFVPFALEGTSLLEMNLPLNSVVIRSLTKELGLPGLRMGYLVAQPACAQALAGLLPAWPLGAAEIAAGVAGMEDIRHLELGAELARNHVARVSAAFAGRGLQPWPSDVNYVLISAPGAGARLAERGIAVRDCASFGLPDHIRVSAPRQDDLATVLRAIEALP